MCRPVDDASKKYTFRKRPTHDLARRIATETFIRRGPKRIELSFKRNLLRRPHLKLKKKKRKRRKKKKATWARNSITRLLARETAKHVTY